MQQLGHDQIRDLVVHRRAEEDDPLIQEAGVDVERTLPAGGLFDNHRYEWAHGPRFVSLRSLESFRWLTARAAPLGRRLATADRGLTRVLRPGSSACDQESDAVAGTGLAESATRSHALRWERSSLRLS